MKKGFGMEKYEIKFKHGIHDLKSEYAFHGNSQGDESVSNSIATYQASQGWMSFMFDCPMTEEAIAIEVAKNKAWNKEYIQKLKDEGRFGEEYTITMSVQEHPLFDTPKHESPPSESYQMVFIDTAKYNKKDD